MSRPAGHLGRMYGLLFVLLGAIGLNAGWVATMAYDLSDSVLFDACMANAGTWWPAADLATAEATSRELQACLRPVTGPWALIMLAGALTAYALTAVLAAAGAVRVRHLIRTAGRATGPAVDAAVARFAELCHEHGVAARHPELYVLRPGARFAEPFTTAGPARRPLVVVPAAVVCARPGVLDPVVRHELAHVAARDVLLAAGAWWSGWTGVLLPVLAAAPLLAPGRDSAPGYGAGLLVSLVLAGLLLLHRAHVLRLRELAADRAAADRSGHPAALADLLLAAPRSARRPLGRLRALAAVHPGTAARAGALTTGTPGTDAGFLPSMVAALVLVIAVQPVQQAIMNRVGWAGASPRPLYAVTGLLIALLLIPAWARRYAADPRAAWWPPVLGVATGGAAGFFLPGPGLPVSPGTLALSGRWATGPLLFAALAGIAVVLVALAHGVDPDRRGQLVAASLAGAGIAAVTVPAAVQAVIEWAGGMRPTYLRTSVLYGAGLSDAEPVVVVAAVAVLAAVCARAAPRPRPVPRPVALVTVVVVVVAATAGMVLTHLRSSPDADRVADLPLLWHRWWVSALAGVIVLVVLTARAPAGRPVALRLAGALTAAAGVTVATALAQFAARTVTTGWDPDFQPWLLGQYVVVPLRILLLLSALAAPVALAVARWRRPGRALPSGLSVMVTAAATAIVCAAVMGGVGEAVTGGVPDSEYLAERAQPARTPQSLPPPPPPPPGLLTPARARQAVTAAGTLLPGWRRNPSLTGGAEESFCPAGRAASPVTQAEVAAAMGYSAASADQPPAGAHIVVAVGSYRRAPEAGDVFRSLRREIEACRSYTQPNADALDGRSHVRLSVRTPAAVGHPAFAFGMVRTDRASRELAAVTNAHVVIVVVGHHVVSVSVIYPHIGAPPERRLAALDGTAGRVLSTVLGQLTG